MSVCVSLSVSFLCEGDPLHESQSELLISTCITCRTGSDSSDGQDDASEQWLPLEVSELIVSAVKAFSQSLLCSVVIGGKVEPCEPVDVINVAVDLGESRLVCVLPEL